MKRNMKNLNFLLLLFMIIYSVIGLVMILSASSVAAILKYHVSSNYFFLKQLSFTIIGYVVGYILIHIPTSKYSKLSLYRLFMYGMIASLLIVLFVGKIAGGAKSWIEIGSRRIQPLEFTKIALIIYLSIYYYKFSLKQYKKTWQYLVALFYPVVLSLIIFFLLIKQPDLGGALIVAAIMALVFFSIPKTKKNRKIVYRIVFGGLLLCGLLCFAFRDKIFDDYQKERFTFLNPCSRYKDDTGYQVCNSYIAIHNGGISGVGGGNSTQKYMYLPEAHTDFIFAILVEELGLIVGILVVLGYFIMLFIILKIAKSAQNLRNSILAYGVFAYLFAHIAVNLLGILGLIPLTGVPLPFLSYGGSYNICVIVSLFIVQRINIETRISREQENIKNIK